MLAKKTFLTIAISIALSACGGGGGGSSDGGGSGGGGGGGGEVTPPPVVDNFLNPARVTLNTDVLGNQIQAVKVGVIDTGFKIDHDELKPFVGASGEFAASGTIDDNVKPHGTDVAQIIGGKHAGFSGNVELLLAKAANDKGLITSTASNSAAEWAIDYGAKIVNFSITNVMIGVAPEAMKGMYDKALANDALLVMAAGNTGENLSSDPFNFQKNSIFHANNTAYKEQAMLVGAITKDGKLDPYSSFAGENKDVQSRFLVAVANNEVVNHNFSGTPTVNDTHEFTGTSGASPVVTAAAATLRAYKPSLTAKQATDILLKTADKSFTELYSKNTCGASKTENCGYLYFGQGKLDLNSAIKEAQK